MMKSVDERKRQRPSEPSGIHVVAKPMGPVCDLNCEYCFYLDKQALFGPEEKYRMSEEVLSAFIMHHVNIHIRK